LKDSTCLIASNFILILDVGKSKDSNT
jgi:hypothetical protein